VLSKYEISDFVPPPHSFGNSGESLLLSLIRVRGFEWNRGSTKSETSYFGSTNYNASIVSSD